jgi:hypothetical protein
LPTLFGFFPLVEQDRQLRHGSDVARPFLQDRFQLIDSGEEGRFHIVLRHRLLLFGETDPRR